VLHLVVVSPIKRKEKKKKRNINNDLAVLPSHNSEIEIGAETWSGHGGPRLSMKARWRLGFAKELSE